jgi:hypothetical protein
VRHQVIGDGEGEATDSFGDGPAGHGGVDVVLPL